MVPKVCLRLLLTCTLAIPGWSFVPIARAPTSFPLKSTASPSMEVQLETLKTDLFQMCSRGTKPQMYEVNDLIHQIEETGELVGIGQATTSSGLLAGEWELVYSPEDATRSSPFFWAFRRAFPDSSDQIFGITDSIPAPIKEVGPAFQEIELDTNTGTDRFNTITGRFVSRVEVATLGGMATSIMTTRASIEGTDGIDGFRIKVETTKPEESTVVKKLFGQFADAINEKAPPFPSGEALEKVNPGASEVIMRTSFCDETLRISRNDEAFDEPYVWRRRAFATANDNFV